MRFESPIYGESKTLNGNGFHSIAAIAVSLDSYFSGEITISDCNRVINLAIDFDSRESAKNSIHKINTLIDVLTNYKKVVEKLDKELNKEFYDLDLASEYGEEASKRRKEILERVNLDV